MSVFSIIKQPQQKLTFTANTSVTHLKWLHKSDYRLRSTEKANKKVFVGKGRGEELTENQKNAVIISSLSFYFEFCYLVIRKKRFITSINVQVLVAVFNLLVSLNDAFTEANGPFVHHFLYIAFIYAIGDEHLQLTCVARHLLAALFIRYVPFRETFL